MKLAVLIPYSQLVNLAHVEMQLFLFAALIWH
jgi:hypothetical protein